MYLLYSQRLVEAEDAASALSKTGLDLLEQLKRALGAGIPVTGALGQLIGQGALRPSLMTKATTTTMTQTHVKPATIVKATNCPPVNVRPPFQGSTLVSVNHFNHMLSTYWQPVSGIQIF